MNEEEQKHIEIKTEPAYLESTEEKLLRPHSPLFVAIKSEICEEDSLRETIGYSKYLEETSDNTPEGHIDVFFKDEPDSDDIFDEGELQHDAETNDRSSSSENKDMSMSTMVFNCNHCNFQTSEMIDLKRHSSKHDRKSLKCNRCSFVTAHKHSLKRHRLGHKYSGKRGLLKCDRCPYKTNIKFKLVLHGIQHDKEFVPTTGKCNYVNGEQCPKCNYYTSDKSNFRRHVLNHLADGNSKEYICHHCGYKSRRKENLKIHIFRRHMPKEEKNVSQKLYKGLHEIPDGAELYKCDNCTFQTIYKMNMRRHTILHKNSDEIIYFHCDLCSYKSRRKDELKKHLGRHKKNESEKR